ncbi:crotonyl-CoA carboxylase/reductase, partial [Streptomyces sp. MCAF7]
MAKSLYELGEVPPLGVVPEKMYATVIRQDRFGEPAEAMQTEVVSVPKPGHGEVLVYVMAAGINYNNVWASLG